MTDYQKIASDMRAEYDARQNALTYSLGDAIKNNPDEYARMKKWSEASGISMDLITGGDFRAEAQEAAYLQGMNIGKLWENAPTTAQALTDPDVAGVAHDDVENLSLLERTIRDILPKPKSTLGLPGYNAQGERTGRGAIGGAAHSVRRAGGNFAAGLAVDPNAAVWGWAQGGAEMLQEMTGSETVGHAADWFGKMRKTSEGIGNKLAGDGSQDGLIEGGVYSGFRSTGMMLPGMVLSIMSGGVSAPALITMGVNAGGQSVGKGLDHGLPAGQALMYGAEDAVAEMATEAIPVAKFLGDLKAGAGFWKIIGNQMVREAPTEAVATAWQGANEWMNLNPEKSFGDYIREQGPAQAQTLVAVMTTTLLTGGFGAGYNRFANSQKKAEEAERNAKAMEQFKELVAVSKVLQRDPATFERFVEDAGGATTVFVDGQALYQSGLAEQVIGAVTPETAQQLRTAMETGGQAAIPVGEYAARIAPLDESNALLDNIKLDDPDGYTRAEAQQYLQSQVQDMEADMERRASQVEAQDVFRNDAAYIRDRVNEVLTAYGKTSPQANPVLSTLWGNHFATLAQDTGQSVQSLWQQFGLRMGRQKGQQAYGQGSGRTFAAENLATLGDFQTGKPVTFNYVHNTDSATERFGLPQEGDPYQRDIEPSGRYVSAGDLAAGAPANLTGGTLTFNNPLQNETPQTSGLGSTAHKAGAGTNEGGAYNQNIEQVPGDVNLEVLEQGPAARGAFTPANWNIELFKNADLSTFLHESGHFFLEMRLDVANQLQAKVNAGQQLTPGEQRIMRDMQTVMQWFGLRDLNEWNNLDFEERRSYHEQFARGFEAYLFEGKAPNIEMHSLFQRFRAWLLNVYKELEALNVELTDEVRGTFDRMLATDEQIELAEQGRSMLPLFASAEQAGMTTEEFAAYQLLGAEATADAAADLQARGIRDMQWLRNARSKRLKALQAEAKERRAEIEMQVRKEVQQRSVYRVWQFLTNKMTAEDKVPVVEPPKQTRTLNPEVDNLFQAIAKLGGLHRADVESLWGFGKKERSPQAGFGLYVLRKEGHSIEAMTEKLVEAGYLIPDADGQVDPAVFEEKFHEELAGNSQYSIHHDIAAQQEMRAGEQAANLEQLGAGRLDLAALKDMGLADEVVNVLVARKMTAKNGLHPDLVAELFVDPEMQEPMFESGDALVHYLATANDMQAEIEAITDQRMLEQYGEIATPEALERAADAAIHNDARARMITTEANAIGRAIGKPKIMLQAAKQYASAAVGRLKIRNVKPLQYSNAEARAAKAADKAMKVGDTELAASEKRNQLLNNQLAREAHLAREEVDKGLRYFKRFDKIVKGIDFEYQDQIHQLLERFDLRKGQTRKAVDKRKGLAEWIKAQEDLGMAPNLDPLIAAEAFKTSYLEMTVEEFRGLKDAVEQIEHLGRLKKKLLTAQDQREFNAIAEEAAATIIDNGGKAKNVPLEPDRGLLSWARGFLASHRKFSSLMRQMDGGKDAGIMQETLTRTMNDRGTWEAVQQEKATMRLGEIYAPLLELGKLNDKKLVPGTDISLSRAGRMSVLLNMGNQDNMQRLQTTFTPAQLRAIVAQTNEVEAQFVNDVWEFLDSYWPDVAAKEKRLTGKEPGKVEAAPFEITLADGSQRQMRGGYYPIKYDAAASDRAASNDAAQQAKEMMAGAYTRATTRRGHTKARQENVNQKLAFDLNVITQHVQQVTHDLAWHEWLIDANRMLSDKRITGAIRDHYGHEILDTLKDHVKSIATDNLQTMDAMDMVAAYLKGAVARSTMGLSMTTALMQPFGLTQSMYRIGPRYVISGMRHWLGDAARFQNSMREISEKSDFMRLRDKTFNRELAQINATVSKGKGKARQVADASLFYLMQKMQLIADVPTWWGAYDKAIDQGLSEEQAVRMADQAVIESQGGGQTKDLAAVQRNHPFLTMFYSYFSVTYNLMAESTASTNWRSPASIAGWMGDMAMLAVIPAMGPSLLLMLLKGEGSDDDDLATWSKRLLGWQAGYLMSAVVGLREASGLVAGYDYTGPAVTRAFADAGGLMKQAQQGELDEGLALSSVRLTGTLLGLPTTQAIRSYRGWKAWDEGDAPITSLLVGPPAKD